MWIIFNLLAASKEEPWRQKVPTSEVLHSQVCLLREQRCTSINTVYPMLPVWGRSPASARCSSACPVRSEAPAAGPSLQRGLPWAYDRPSPDTRDTRGRRRTLRTSLDVHLSLCQLCSKGRSPLWFPWFHSVTPVCPASRGPPRSACRSARNRCETTHSDSITATASTREHWTSKQAFKLSCSSFLAPLTWMQL